jgi:alpha-glucosidase
MNSTPWWRTAVIYQIYPRSFQDSNGDGVGDLPGITARLDYLVQLGVDAIWISPISVSPMADFGYDVADYTGIDPLFGSLKDFDALIEAAHGRDIKVILDLVPNHTSDKHPWFIESRRSRYSPKRDWYIWHDPHETGAPPNNWLSDFGGSAWKYDDLTGQCYYHAFLAAQPDLNWRNPDVRSAVYDAMRFWFRRGVDGFRIDVIWHLIKDDQFRDNPPDPRPIVGAPVHESLLPLYTTDRPEVHEIIAEMRGVADEFIDRVLIGEIYLPVERLVAYYGRDLNGLHLPFNFSLLNSPWNARAIANLIEDYEAHLPAGGWPNWVLGNHDRPRIASRIGAEQTRVAAMLLLTLRGTPTIYYGDEIGMEQVPIPEDRIRDPLENNIPGRGLGRDGGRTPMPWDGRAYAGFSTVEPWLPLPETARTHNVETERAEPTSLYNLCLRLIALRRTRRALSVGAYRPLSATGDLLLFTRGNNEDRILVALNFGGDPISVSFPSGSLSARLLISSAGNRDNEQVNEGIDLRPHEGAVIELTQLSISG